MVEDGRSISRNGDQLLKAKKNVRLRKRLRDEIKFVGTSIHRGSAHQGT